MFSTQAIVLKKTEVRNGEFLYHLLTRDFGRIRAWATKRKKIDPVDHGSIIRCMISTKQSRNTIESAKVTHAIRADSLRYDSLVNILSCLRHTSTFLSEWAEYPTIFDDYVASLPFFEQESTNHRSTVFFTLKVLKSSGVMGEALPTEADEALCKIVRHIDRYPIKTFHLIQGVSDEIIRDLHNHNERHILPYLS